VRLGTAHAGNGAVPVIATEEGLAPLAVSDGAGLRDLIAAGADALAAAVDDAGEPLEDAALVAPLCPGKIVCIGLNYLDHIRESHAEPPAAPLIFAKFPSSVIGPGEPIPVDGSLSARVDWEVELAVVIGRRMRRVPASEALAGVFGYTVANDVSARDLQLAEGQWVRAKSLDGFCPLGPTIATADEVGDPQALGLRTLVNGETMQDS